MKKQIDPDTWSQIKGKYVAGSDPIYKIAQQHDINKKTIERRAQKEGWIYGSMKINVSEAIQTATIETIIKTDTDKSVRLTEIFLKDASNIRGITMAIVKSMGEELKRSGGNLATAEANRLYQCQKVSEVASKTVSNLYAATRKALGMDREDDIEKAHKIKGAEKQPATDPCENLTETELDDQLKKLED